jgi:prepilin-type processing-associated H-X9-DG protein
VRACPAFRAYERQSDQAFERGNGGYGYNLAYIGRILYTRGNGSCRLLSDESGVASDWVRCPSDTLMFADAAFAGGSSGLIEYSFAEPRFHPEWIHVHARTDPSIHFRHRHTANVAWCDGHVAVERRSFTWSSGLYPGDPDQAGIGWFGARDDNGHFDLD